MAPPTYGVRVKSSQRFRYQKMFEVKQLILSKGSSNRRKVLRVEIL